MSVAAVDSGNAVSRVEAAWQRRRRVRHWQIAGGLVLFVAACLAAADAAEFSLPLLWSGLPRTGEYLHRILPILTLDRLFDGVKVKGSIAYWFFRFHVWVGLLLETIEMAWLGTLAAAVGGAVLSFFAASNLTPHRGASFVVRRALELLRTVPDLVYALILVWAYGVGPLAGVLAMALHSTGSLGKLFTEINENIEMPPLDGIRGAGSTWAQIMRFGVVPQVLPNFVSYVLLRFEINVRSAAVLGFVGAGGIGQELYAVVSQNYYSDISAILLLIILCVTAIDLASERLRHCFIGDEAAL